MSLTQHISYSDQSESCMEEGFIAYSVYGQSYLWGLLYKSDKTARMIEGMVEKVGTILITSEKLNQILFILMEEEAIVEFKDDFKFPTLLNSVVDDSIN